MKVAVVPLAAVALMATVHGSWMVTGIYNFFWPAPAAPPLALEPSTVGSVVADLDLSSPDTKPSDWPVLPSVAKANKDTSRARRSQRKSFTKVEAPTSTPSPSDSPVIVSNENFIEVDGMKLVTRLESVSLVTPRSSVEKQREDFVCIDTDTKEPLSTAQPSSGNGPLNGAAGTSANKTIQSRVDRRSFAEVSASAAMAPALPPQPAAPQPKMPSGPSAMIVGGRRVPNNRPKEDRRNSDPYVIEQTSELEIVDPVPLQAEKPPVQPAAEKSSSVRKRGNRKNQRQ